MACGLAMGHRVAWMSRVGDDPFWGTITQALARYGVDPTLVDVDRERPTGLYLKDPTPDSTRVYYYRRRSAASAIGPCLAERSELHTARLLHLSGTTPALSDSYAAFVQRLFIERPVPEALLSFDVKPPPRPVASPGGCPAASRPGPRHRSRLRRP